MSLSHAKTFARQVPSESTAEGKLDKLARALVELIAAMEQVESRINNIYHQTAKL